MNMKNASMIPVSTVLACVALLLFALPSSVSAGVRNCTAALVTSGICTNASDQLVYFSLPTTDPDAAGPRVAISTQVVEGCALYFGYQTTIAGSPNPETKPAFCDRMMRTDFLRALGALYYASQAEQVKQTTIAATPADSVP